MKQKYLFLAILVISGLLASGQVVTNITPSAKLTIHGNNVSIWGNVTNAASTTQAGAFTIKDGAKIIFYGSSWQNINASNINGETLVTGEVDFKGPRPMPYAGVFSQNLTGGGELQSFPSLTISNNQNLNLTGSSIRVRNSLKFAIDDGHIISNGNDLIVGNGTTLPGSITGYNPLRYFVTNQCGTGHLVRKGFNNTTQVFPVGRAENDYAPAAVLPQGSLNRVSVNVCDYASSLSNETTLLSMGMNRTWNIFGNAADSATLVLQHNVATNNTGGGGPGTYADQNAFLVYNSTGNTWANYSNTPVTFATGNLQDGGGSIPNTAMHSRKYPLVTSPISTAANFTKDFNASAVPITELTLSGRYNRGSVDLNWKVSGEFDVIHYEITRSTNGINFENIGQVRANNIGSSIYSFLDDVSTLNASKIYYRLKILNRDGSVKFSYIVVINLGQQNQLAIYPNPANTVANLSFSVMKSTKITLSVYDVKGNLLHEQQFNASAGNQSVQLNHLERFSNGSYQVILTLESGERLSQKLLIIH